MRTRHRFRAVGRRLLSPGLDLAHTIVSITDDGTSIPLVRTAGPHGLSGSEAVTLSGCSDANYNTSDTVFDAPSATTFRLTVTGYFGDSAGGAWRLG